MKSRLARLTAGLAAGFAALFSLGSCNEDAILRSNLAPAVDNINTFGIGPDFGNDTVVMHVRTVYQDTLNTSLRQAGLPVYHGLGWVNDPYAGTTSSSIYMQILPSVAGFKFAANEVLDSLVIVLPYGGFTWGDTANRSATQVRAYAITEGFSKDIGYFNYSRLQTASSPLGSATIYTGRAGTGVIQDSTPVRQWVGGTSQQVNKQAHLRIKIQDTAQISTAFRAAIAADSTLPAFANLFPGFYLMADTTNGPGVAMPYFRLNTLSTGSGLFDRGALVAYTHLRDGNTDSAIANQFIYDLTNGAHFNRITRNLSGTPANSIVNNTDTVQQVVLMQNAPGAAIDVVLPKISQLPKDVLIVKAELKLTQVPAQGDNIFFGPNRLYPEGVNSGGARYIIADRYSTSPGNNVLDNIGFVDGNVEFVTVNGVVTRQYKLNFPQELQRAIIKGSNLHLRIGGTSNYPAAYRILFGGRGQSDIAYRPTLNIIYSKQRQ